MTRPHGTYTRYKHGPDEDGTEGRGCRCAACRKESASRQDRRRRLVAYGRWEGWVHAAGTQRRIQALMWNGWSIARLAARLGCSRNVLRLKATRNKMVTPATARAVSALYDELWDQPPPAGTPHEKKAAAVTRRYAREHGYVPPLAWCDDEIDDPAASPVPRWERPDEADDDGQQGEADERAA